jgi:predicted nuclease with TOPRIM domain
MSFKKNSKNKYKKINNKNTKKMIKKGGLGPTSIYNTFKSFMDVSNATRNEMIIINNLKKQLEDNSYKMKENVNKFYSLYNQLFKKTQSLYSKIDTLTSLQSKCSELYPRQDNTKPDEFFSFGKKFKELLNVENIPDKLTSDSKSLITNIEDNATDVTSQTKKYIDNIENNFSFETENSKLQTTIDELKKEILTLNEEMSQLKKKHESEQLMISTALKTPVSDNDLDNLTNISSNSSSSETNTPSVLENNIVQPQTISNPITTPIGEHNNEQPQPLSQEQPQLLSQEQPQLLSQEQPQLLSQEQSQEQPQLLSQEQPQEQSQEPPREQKPEPPREQLQEQKPEPPHEQLQEQPETPNQPTIFKPIGNTISEIINIPKTDKNQIPQQNGGKINYNISKKRRYNSKMNKSINIKNREKRFYL